MSAMGSDVWLWAGFTLVVLGMLALDLGVVRRRARAVSLREAGVWTAVWVSLALLFYLAILRWRGPEPALEFLTGYLIEYALSVDNIFVFVLIFSYFAVPAAHQHRLLFWGILGALLMRGVMIVAGAALIKEFHWIIYLFGAFLIVTGIRTALDRGHAVEPAHNPVVRLARRVLPVATEYHGQRFFVRRDGVLMATPLFVVLLLIETTDLVFAVDSIPAIFAITTDPFIVYTSNVFAILGLRSLYFLLAGIIHRFQYLKYGLAVILTFVGLKMVLTDVYKVPIHLSLGVVAAALLSAVVASLLQPAVAPTWATLRRATTAGWGWAHLRAAAGAGLVLGWALGAIAADWLVEQPVVVAYDPRAQAAPAGLGAAEPARLVDELLRRSGHLPPVGTQLVARPGGVDWEAPPSAALPIAAVDLQRVRLVSDGSLERVVKGAEPSFMAIVEALVTTATGDRVALRVQLHTGGRLTPWRAAASGEGWRPRAVEWYSIGPAG
jgi:tellurite resistance protein TerC